MVANIDVNDNPQSPSYPALSFMSKKIMPGQGGSPFSVPVTWYGRPLGSSFPSPLSPKDIDQYHISGLVNMNLTENIGLELSLTPVSYTHLRAHETREDRGLRLVG